MAGKKMQWAQMEIQLANTLHVSVGTTGLQEEGGATILKLTETGSSSMNCYVERDGWGAVKDIQLEFYGDKEALSLLEALKFAVRTLESHIAPLDQAIPRPRTKERNMRRDN